jgi:copper chaperone CopZ
MSMAPPDHAKQTRCVVKLIEKEVDAQQLAQAATVILRVRGMGCPTCALRVHNGLLAIEGVLAVEVALQYGLARVWYDAGRLQPQTLTELLPVVTADGRHHYTAQILVLSQPTPGGEDATPS